MKILSSLFSIFVLILLFGESAIANLQQVAYQDGSSFIKQIHKNPGEPDKSYLPQGDVSHLQDTNDTRLSAKGIAAKADPNNHADLLDTSQAEMIKAKGEHDINKNNSFYQKSAQIEANPFSQTGGSQMQQKSTVTKELAEYCLEGVDFQVDVVNQLTYVPPPWTTRTIYEEFNLNLTEYWHQTGLNWDNWAPREWGFTNSNGALLSVFTDMSYFKPYCKGSRTCRCVVCSRIQRPNFGNCDNITSIAFVNTNLNRNSNLHEQLSWFVRIKIGREERYRAGNGTEEWNIVNPETEKLTEENSCHEIRRACLDSGTKYFDGLTVSRPCWREQITYQCTSDPEDGCKYLKDRKCTLQSSHCSKQVGNMCMQYRRHYICLIKDEIMSTNITGTDMFCLDGNCFTPEIDQNTDMNEAVSKLAILQEMQKQMGGNPPKVFTGTPMNCAKHMTSFLNCCSSMKGWGRDIGLGKCSNTEKALADQRAKGLCHYVGTHCAERVLGKCVRKRSSYCCFGSKLSRIFHEQGRPQIGKGWGNSEYPNCEAFTVDDLTKMDFSKMDLSELFDEIFKNVDKALQKAVPHQVHDQMPKLQQNHETNAEAGKGSW